jgi:uncharacterized coiled-coil protein SlyX
MPATETRDFEREFEQLVRELRAIPSDAPDQLRARVRGLGEPKPSHTLREVLLSIRWRRSLLVFAPVCVLAVVSAALVHGLLDSGRRPQPVAQTTTEEHSAALKDSSAGKAFGAFVPTVPSPVPGRYQDYDASLSVRVKDVDTLHDRTAEATRLARLYGGTVVSVVESSAGASGQSDLVLRIPVARVQDAYFRLSKLGTVTAQELSIRDLDQVVAAQRQRIARLKLQIARITETLKDSSLAADVRLRLQLQRDAARGELARVTGTNKSTLREASMARISLNLTASTPASGANAGGGRFDRAVHEAGRFLAGAGAVVLFLLIVLSPLVVLAVAGTWGRKAYRRREERRLLAHP